MPRRRHRRGTARTAETATASSSSTSTLEAPDDKIHFDPDKLCIAVEGQWKSFNEWTLEYARHYYPNVGHKTYRVPPLDFNTQALTDVTKLGFAELHAPAEDTRKKDRSQADVGIRLEELGRQLEQCGDGGLFIVSNAHYDNYLSDLKNLRTKGSGPPPLPREKAQRGELDFLVLHSQQGVLLVQVKGVGLPDSWKPSKDQLQAAVRKKVREAENQLARDVQVLQHVMGDLQLTCDHHTVVALPFISSHLLVASVPDAAQAAKEQGATVYLCAEHMSSREAMLSWWNTYIVQKDSSPLKDFQLQSIAGRYCGLLSTVSVWCKSSFRVEVRDVAEAAVEVGNRFASLVLTAQQREALDWPGDFVFLHGPPGTGKSVLMIIKARQWLRQGHDVFVLNVDFGRSGNPVGHYIHDAINQWLLKICDESVPSDLENMSTGETKLSSAAFHGERPKGHHNSVITKCDNCDPNPDNTISHCADDFTSIVQKECDSPETVGQMSTDPDSKTSERQGSHADKGSTEPDIGSVTSSSYSSSLCSSSDGESSQQRDIGQVFRIDFDLGMNVDNGQAQNRVQQLLELVQQTVRPGVTCHFVFDEFYWKDRLLPVVTQIRQHFPDSCVWCAEVSGDKVPPGFTPFMLTSVLRCPPAVQSVLKKVDWMEDHKHLYVDDSTLQGLPTDGFKPVLLEHKQHCAVSPLDCVQCADMVLNFFREELKLEFGRGPDHAAPPSLTSPAEVSDHHPGLFSPPFPSSLTTPLGEGKACTNQHVQQMCQKSLPVPKSKKKKRTICLPRRVRFSDIVVLFSYPQQCLNRASNLLLVEDKPQDIHHDNIENSVFLRRMTQAGLPVVFRAPNSDAREIALPTEDRIFLSVTNAVTGLERKVVVYIPCESTTYQYPVTRKPDHHTQSPGSLQPLAGQTTQPSANCIENACNTQDTTEVHEPHPPIPNPKTKTDASVCESRLNSTVLPEESVTSVMAGLCDDDWAKINARLLEQNKKGLFYAASRSLSVFVLIIP